MMIVCSWSANSDSGFEEPFQIAFAMQNGDNLYRFRSPIHDHCIDTG
jgi:hypothetical protein